MSDALDAKRYTAATLCLQGLLSGNSQLRVPTEAVVYAFARDAVRFADALLHTLESNKTPEYATPVEPDQVIYPGDSEDLEAIAEWTRRETELRAKLGEAPIRVDVGPVGAPVPEQDPRGE